MKREKERNKKKNDKTNGIKKNGPAEGPFAVRARSAWAGQPWRPGLGNRRPLHPFTSPRVRCLGPSLRRLGGLPPPPPPLPPDARCRGLFCLVTVEAETITH
jgi:hypothetical protein